jgi:hypothetical protein
LLHTLLVSKSLFSHTTLMLQNVAGGICETAILMCDSKESEKWKPHKRSCSEVNNSDIITL